MITSLYRTVVHHIWKIFLSGLLTLLPFMLTTIIITFFYRLIDSWVAPVYAYEPSFLQNIPGSALFIVMIIIFLVGLFIKLFFLEPLVLGIENIFTKLPLVRPVYGGVKQLVSAFGGQNEAAFQKVVMVPFAGHNSYSIGFLTSELPLWVNPNSPQQFFNVFIPTTPNPTSGFLVQVPQESVIITSLSRQEAMSMIISGGIIQPSRENK